MERERNVEGPLMEAQEAQGRLAAKERERVLLDSRIPPPSKNILSLGGVFIPMMKHTKHETF